MDVWYVDHVSLKTDLSVLAATVRAVIKHEGISGEGTETMTEFMGTREDV